MDQSTPVEHYLLAGRRGWWLTTWARGHAEMTVVDNSSTPRTGNDITPEAQETKENVMTSIRSRVGYRRTATTLSVLLFLGLAGFSAPAALGAKDTGHPISSTQSAPSSQSLARAGSTPITRAKEALATATSELQAGHPGRAITALDDLRHQVRLAHRAALDLIGKPPTDPESDEPPGPPAVLAMLALEHRVAMGTVPLFEGQTRTDVVDALHRALRSTLHRRDVMLDQVIALRPAARGDYEDGMADTLGQYPKEEQQLATALSTYHLSPSAQTALQDALAQVRATEAKVTPVFGGGERSPRL
jgi:hypothetical protein